MKAITYLQLTIKLHKDYDPRSVMSNEQIAIENIRDRKLLDRRTINFYSQKFESSLIIKLFDGWEHAKSGYTETTDYYENEKEKAEFKFIGEHCFIAFKGSEFQGLPKIKTLNDFISDCSRLGIQLIWKEEIAEEYFQ